MDRRRRIDQRNKVQVFVAVFVLLLFSSLVLAACGGSATGTAAAVQSLTPAGYEEMFGSGQTHMLIDVRTPEEFASGHIEGSVNIPVESLADRLNEVPRDLPLVVYCRTGNRSATAARILVDAGYAPVYDLGGLQSWVAAGYPIIQ
jgi:phage shock protein E